MLNKEEVIKITGDAWVYNCEIKRTMLGFEDHGIMTCDLTLEGDGWGCAFGGFKMDSPKGMECIKELLKTLKTDTWEQLKGQYIRVVTKGEFGRVVAVGHLIEDRWFSFKNFFEAGR